MPWRKIQCPPHSSPVLVGHMNGQIGPRLKISGSGDETGMAAVRAVERRSIIPEKRGPCIVRVECIGDMVNYFCFEVIW